MSLLWFAREQVDYAILEVGLGGRLDSTNVIRPEVSVITSIGMDHMAYLGNTVEEIAAEKAGIIKKRVPLVTSANGPALRVIEEIAARRGCPVMAVGHNLIPIPLKLSEQGTVFNLILSESIYVDLEVSLLGLRQVENAAVAVQVAALLDISESAIRRGLKEVRWPGRLEVFSRDPLIVLDGAHNEPGFQALAESVNLLWHGKRICAIMGMLADKQREQALPRLLPLLDSAIVTPPPYLSRVGDWQRWWLCAAKLR